MYGHFGFHIISNSFSFRNPSIVFVTLSLCFEGIITGDESCFEDYFKFRRVASERDVMHTMSPFREFMKSIKVNMNVKSLNVSLISWESPFRTVKNLFSEASLL